jgi:2-haloacid dehalogenase
MTKAVIFDAYGTLLDVHGAMRAHAAVLGEDWQAISHDWRTKQLEYTWIAALTGQHRNFWDVTRDALRVAAAKYGIEDQALLDEVAASYRALPAYPEVPDMLDQLRAKGLPCAILSNGEPAMLDEAVQAAGIKDRLAAVLSVESAGIYKPARAVYELATARFGVAPADLAFLSSNAWDAFGAQVFGCQVFWVNRLGGAVEYGLDQSATILRSLHALPDLL